MTVATDPPSAAGASEPEPRPNGAATLNRSFLFIAAAASIAAGIIHTGAIASHSDHRAVVWTFLVVAVVQIGWGVLAVSRPSRSIAYAGMALGLAAFGGWVLAKTHGIPFINGLNTKEPAEFADSLCAELQFLVFVASALTLFAPRLIAPRALVGAVVVAVVVVTAPGTASAVTHVHNHGGTVVLEPAPAVPPHPYDPTLPIDLSGVPGVTPQEQARAENLLSATVLLLPQWSDPAYDEAHGFFSIGDGVTGTEHYLNLDYIKDDVMLDPDRPESLVWDTTVHPKRLVAAMYMATPGMTLAQVPDIGGPLTQWHVHNNLCFNAQGRVAGLTQPDGTCRAPLTKGAEIPMIHVWIVPHRCGPFAALEGVGGGQVLPGQPVACDHVHAP